MNKLDKKILEVVKNSYIRPTQFAVEHGAMTDKEVDIYIISQIKQSILKAIMDAKPEREPTMKPEEWAMGYEYGIEEFESVIKEVLQTKTNE